MSEQQIVLGHATNRNTNIHSSECGHSGDDPRLT